MAITLNGTTGITTPALDSSGPLTSLGIDDNATSTAITIDASQNVGIGGTVTSTAFGSQLATTLFTQNVLKSSVASSAGAFIRMAVSGSNNPTYSFEDDQNTGIFTSGADTLNFSTAATERMRIDSAGRVTMPYQPAFISFMTVGSTAVIVPFDAVSLNRGSGFNTSTYRFTAPVSGVYWFDLRVTFAGSGVNPNAGIIYLGINGTRGRDFFEGMPAWSTNTELSSSVIIALTANDYVDIRNPNGGTIQGGNAIYYSLFSGYLIG